MQVHTQTHMAVLLTWTIHRQTRCVCTYPFTQFPSSCLPGGTQEKLQEPLGDVVTRVNLQLWQLLWAEAVLGALPLAVPIMLQMPQPRILPMDLHKALSPGGAWCPGLGLSQCPWAAPLQSGVMRRPWLPGPDALGILPNNSCRS